MDNLFLNRVELMARDRKKEREPIFEKAVVSQNDFLKPATLL